MKSRKVTYLLTALVAVLLIAGMLSVTAAADAGCQECQSAGLEFTGLTATTKFEKISETECARVFKCNNGHEQLTYKEDGTFDNTSAHVASTNATCESAAVCGNCKCTYGAPLQHEPVVDKAVAATCTTPGLTEGSHCGLCGKTLVEQQVIANGGHLFDAGVYRAPTCDREGGTLFTCKLCGTKELVNPEKVLSHWYAEWTPAGRGFNSAPCKRQGCQHTKTINCVEWNFKMVEGEEVVDYTLCPVCGALEDGGCLKLVEDAKPTPVTGWTPQGDMVIRHGALENGEELISVAFEFDARLTQCTGLTKFTIPAELLEGRQVMLLDAEGNETELEVEVVGDYATFELDFARTTQRPWVPVRILHLVPIVEEAEVVAETEPATEPAAVG